MTGNRLETLKRAHSIDSIEPAEVCGPVWTGTYQQAGDGSLQALIAEVRQATQGAMTGLSINDRPDGFRYLIGSEDGVSPGGVSPQTWRLDGHHCLRMPYEGSASGVTTAYQEMLDALTGSVWEPRPDICHHRDEYGRSNPLDDPLTVTLGIPVRRRS